MSLQTTNCISQKLCNEKQLLLFPPTTERAFFDIFFFILPVESSYIIFHSSRLCARFYCDMAKGESSKWTSSSAVILHFYWINKSIYNLFSLGKNPLECFLLSALSFFFFFFFSVLWITNDKLSGGRAQAPLIIQNFKSSFYVLLKSFASRSTHS